MTRVPILKKMSNLSSDLRLGTCHKIRPNGIDTNKQSFTNINTIKLSQVSVGGLTIKLHGFACMSDKTDMFYIVFETAQSNSKTASTTSFFLIF